MEIQRYNSIRIFWYFFYLLGICYTIFAIIGSLSGTIFSYLLSGKQAQVRTRIFSGDLFNKSEVHARFYRYKQSLKGFSQKNWIRQITLSFIQGPYLSLRDQVGSSHCRSRRLRPYSKNQACLKICEFSRLFFVAESKIS